MKRQLLILSLFLFSNFLTAQNTVGLLSYEPSKAFDGYNMIYPHNQPNVYLLDNCGEIVHVWEDSSQFRPGNTAYLLFNGNLLKTKRRADISNDPIWAGGGGAIVEIRTWENELLWQYELNNENYRLHHDIALTDDGNIMMVAWEKKTEAEAIQAGRDTALIPDGEVWSEALFEINPATNEIEWEWHLWDHLVQDFDPTKDNYVSNIADHPDRMNINYTSNDGGRDWAHINAVDMIKNVNLDQDHVVVSVPFFDEIWVIDHTTNSDQAAGSTGGLSGKGGDFLYRWGNHTTWDGPGDQTLFFQHDIEYVDDFLEPNHPHYGKFSCFNNRAGADFSSFVIFNPFWEMYELEYPMENGTWGPEGFDVELTHPDSAQRVYSTGLSSMQVLPNGNFLICSGRQGYSFELTPDNEVVWEYVTPLIGGLPATQGDILALNNNLTFRIRRIPSDYQAFVGKDLSPKGWIEVSPNTTFCDGLVNSVEEMTRYNLEVYPNPADDQIVIEWEGGIYVDVEVLDLMGRPVMSQMKLTGGRKFLDVSNLSNGVYFVCVNHQETRKVVIQR